jgi:hypothetical protein
MKLKKKEKRKSQLQSRFPKMTNTITGPTNTQANATTTTQDISRLLSQNALKTL